MGVKNLLLLLVALFVAAAGLAQPKSKHRKMLYEEVNFEDMVHRYLSKEPGTPIEGIYSVSCVITQRSTGLFSKEERIRLIERKDHYARVAIIRDWPGSRRDYIEVSLTYREAGRYPIVGEVHSLSEGRGMIYKHIEPDASSMSFSMTSEPSDLIEGEYSFTKGKKTITYKVSYLKIYPKVTELIVDKF